MNGEPLTVFKTRESLLLRLKEEGDEKAWREFHDIYGRLIFGYSLHFNISYAEAEDLVQEVCVKVFRQINTFQYAPEKGRFRGWLKTITRNAVIDYLRRKGNRSRTAQEYRVHLELKQAADQTFDEEVWQKEWEKALYEAALERVRERVGEETYRVFKRYVLENESVQVVADETTMDPNAIYAVKHRVLRYLREEVDRIINSEGGNENENAT